MRACTRGDEGEIAGDGRRLGDVIALIVSCAETGLVIALRQNEELSKQQPLNHPLSLCAGGPTRLGVKKNIILNIAIAFHWTLLFMSSRDKITRAQHPYKSFTFSSAERYTNMGQGAVS